MKGKYLVRRVEVRRVRERVLTEEGGGEGR